MKSNRLVRIDYYNNMGGIYDHKIDDEWVSVDTLIAEGDVEISKAIEKIISEEIGEYEKVSMWFEEDDHIVRSLLEENKRNLEENKDLSLVCPLRSINHGTEHFWEYKII